MSTTITETRFATANPTAPTQQPVTLKRSLSTPALVIFGLSYMVPLTVFSTYGIVTDTTQGHLPMAYLITTLAMLATTLTYASLAKALPISGSAYVFTRKAFGPHVGFLSGWSLLADYLLLPVINYLLIGIYLNAQFPALPAWGITLAMIIIVTTLNILGVHVVKTANLALIALQTVFIAVFIALCIANFAPGVEPIQPFISADMSWAGILSGASILALSFLGFDAVSTLSEEANDPKRTVPRAIVLTTVIGGLTFTVLSWFGHMVFPDWQNFTNLDTASMDVMTRVGGKFLEIFFLSAYISGAFSSAIASQASVARLLYSMGRDHILPNRIVGGVNARFRTPVGALLVTAVFGLLALVLDLDVIASIISFGALAAFSLVNLAAIKHFVLDEGRRDPLSLIRHLVLPVIGFCLTLWLWTSLSGVSLTVGGVWVAIGLTYLAIITKGFRKRPPAVHFDD
ncbi:APC family permease [Pseudoclavibacter albus]|uniref:APC family permease n=1 Tax=Pseudoclavibacter albus TaxID=272241 RepID=UPI000AB319C8|nr:APC family permease [Pseudoclavibacter alba]